MTLTLAFWRSHSRGRELDPCCKSHSKSLAGDATALVCCFLTTCGWRYWLILTNSPRNEKKVSFLFSGFHFDLVYININNTSWHQIPVVRTKVLEFCGFENAFGSRFSSLWLLLKRPFKTAVLSSSFPYFFVFFPFNCLVITKVYSGIQTYRRSVSLSPWTIFFPFNCSFYH